MLRYLQGTFYGTPGAKRSHFHLTFKEGSKFAQNTVILDQIEVEPGLYQFGKEEVQLQAASLKDVWSFSL